MRTVQRSHAHVHGAIALRPQQLRIATQQRSNVGLKAGTKDAERQVSACKSQKHWPQDKAEMQLGSSLSHPDHACRQALVGV